MYGYKTSSSARRRTRGRRTRGAAKSTGTVGSGARMLPQLRAPRISFLEQKLDDLGVPVQRFRQFRAEERHNVTPNSGQCAWYCVPAVNEIGNSVRDTRPTTGEDALTLVRAQIKTSPNTCDLVDIYRNLASTTDSGGIRDFPQRATFGGGFGTEGSFEGGGIVLNPTGTGGLPYSGTATANSLLMSAGQQRLIRPGMDYTARTHITYDNMSSLDAFVEVYKLSYSGRLDRGSKEYEVGLPYTATELCAGTGLPGGKLFFDRFESQHPGYAFCPSYQSIENNRRYQSPVFGGGMLRMYAQMVLYNRFPAYGYTVNPSTTVQMGDANEEGAHVVHLGPAPEESLRNVSGAGFLTNPEIAEQVLCHPKVDPLRTMPRHRVNQCGFKLERVQGPRRVVPGGAHVFNIPNEGTSRWDFTNSVLGDHDQLGSFETQTKVRVPKTVIYCFRVWGDVIHSKYAREDHTETDFVTGTTSVTFTTQRVVWARLRQRYNRVINPVLMPFDDDVPVDEQEHINEEDDKPMAVTFVGAAERPAPPA